MRKILLVEDEQILRETYQLILSTLPYNIDVASDGKAALLKCQSENYDLILLDIMMPVMDGIEFLENLDKLDKMKSKIIILSNLSSGKEIDRARELGISKNFVKSDLSPTQLISAIRYQLNTNQN